MQEGGIMQPQACVKCGAPVGTSGGRCPFCGTEQPKLVSMRPNDVATVGLSDVNRASMGRPPIHRKQKSGAGAAVVFGVVALVLLAGGAAAFFVLRAPSASQPVAQASASVAPPPKQIALTKMGGLPVLDTTKVDPTDYLPKARRQVTAWDKDAKLLELVVTGARRGWVDLGEPGSEVVIRYVSETKDPRAPKGKDVTHDRMVFTLKKGGPDEAEKSAGTPTDRGVPEPTCVWSAAWRSATASGIPADGPVDARFGSTPKSDGPKWVFNGGGVTRQLDATTCAVETR